MNPSRLLRTTFLSILALALVGGLATVQAQDIFVDTNEGNDSNPGTDSQPLATIGEALSQAAADEEIEIASGFYDETVTISKRVDLTNGDNGTVDVNAIVLDGAAASSGNRATVGSRAGIFADGTGTLNVLNTLEIASGFYEVSSSTSLQLADGFDEVTFSAGASGSGSNRFANSSGSAETGFTFVESSYNLTISNSEMISISDDQIPDGSGDINNLVIANSRTVTLPSALNSIGGNLTVESGGSVNVGSGVLSVTGDLTSDGEIVSGGGGIEVSGSVANNGRIADDLTMIGGDTSAPSSVSLSGSGSFPGGLTIGTTDGTNESVATSNEVTVSGPFTLTDGSLDVTGGSITLEGNIIQSVDGANSGFVTDSDGRVVIAGDNAQEYDLDDANRSIDHLTVNKGPVEFLTIDDNDNGGNSDDNFTVDEDFNFQSGRIQLDDNSNSENLVVSGSATLAGVIDGSGSTSLTVDVPSDADLTVAGNGQINVGLTAEVESGDTATFTELTQVGAITKTTGSGTLAFDQQVTLSGLVIGQDGTINFNAGTSSSSTGNLDIDGATVTFGGDATVGTVAVLATDDVNFQGAATTDAVTVEADDVSSGANTPLSFTGSGNTISNQGGTALTVTGSSSTANNVTVDIAGATTIEGDVAVNGAGTDVDSEALLQFADVDGGASSTIEGDVTLTDGSGSGSKQDAKIELDDEVVNSSLVGSHDVTITGNLDTDAQDNPNEVITVDGNTTLGIEGQIQTKLDDGGAGIGVNINGTLRLAGSTQQNVELADDDSSIEGLIVENSRAEDDGSGVNLTTSTSATALDVNNLELLDGELSVNGTNSDPTLQVTNDGSVTRSAGSVVEENNGSVSFADDYDLTYSNGSDITTDAEFGSDAVDDLTLSGSGVVTLGSGSEVNSSLTIESGAELASDGNTLTLDDANASAGDILTVEGSFSGSGDISLDIDNENNYNLAGSGSISTLSSSLDDEGSGSNGASLDLDGALAFESFSTAFNNSDEVLNLNAADASITSSFDVNGGTGQLNFPSDGLSSIEGAASLSAPTSVSTTVTLDSSYTQGSGGAVTLEEGNFDLVVEGDATINTATPFQYDGNGRFVLAGSEAQNLEMGTNAVIERLEINNGSGVSLEGGTLSLRTENLLLTSGTFAHGTDRLQARNGGTGQVTVIGGSLDGSFPSGATPLRVRYENNDDLTAGSELSAAVNVVEVQSADDATVTIENGVTVGDRLTLDSGTLASGGNLTIEDEATITRGNGQLAGTPTFPSISGGDTGITLRYVGSSDVTTGPELPGSFSVSELIVDNSDLTVTADTSSSISTLTLNSGTLDLNEDSLSVFENASVNGSLQASQDGAVILEGGSSSSEIDGTYTSLPTVIASKDQNSNGVFQTATIDRVSSTPSENVAIDGNLIAESGNLVLGNSQVDDVSVSGDFTVASGARQFSDGGNVLAVAGAYDANPGATNAGENFAGDGYVPLDLNATVVFNGSESQTVFQRGAVPGVGNSGDFDFSGLEVNNSAGVTFENDTRVSTLTLQNGIADVGENTLDVDDGSPSAVDRIGGSVEGTLERDLNAGSAGNYVFPLSAGGDFREATIVTTSNTLGNPATVTVSHQDSAFAGNQGLPFTTGSDGEEVEVNAKAPIGWTVSFDSDAGTPAAGEAPDFRFRAQGLEGIGDVNQIRVISRAGEGETGNPFSVAGTHEDALFSGGIPLAVSSGVGGFDISNTQQFTFGSDSAVNDFADADQPATQEIAGTVTYPTVENGDLVGGRSIEGAEVTVSSSDTTATATTDANGEYQIDGLPSGDFDVEVSVSDSVENVSIADALRLIRGSSGTDPFAGAFQREQVADVNDSGTANATDALRIARFDLGLADGFEAGDFATESESVTLESDGVTGVELFVAEVGDVDLSGGDTGGSSQTLAASTISPKQAAAATQSSSASSPETGVKAGETFEVPVRMGRSAEVGSYRMTVNYSAETASFEGVKSAQEGVLTNASSDGTLQVSWFDQSGESALDLRNGSELITLQFKASEDVKKKEFAPKVTSGEITDPEAAPLAAGVELQAVQIGASAPDKFALNGNYPNPVRGQATIDMDLPTSGNVTVEVYNVLGQRVQTMERSMSAGSGQTIKIDGSNLASGQYFYRVEADLEDGSARETGRITVVK